MNYRDRSRRSIGNDNNPRSVCGAFAALRRDLWTVVPIQHRRIVRATLRPVLTKSLKWKEGAGDSQTSGSVMTRRDGIYPRITTSQFLIIALPLARSPWPSTVIACHWRPDVHCPLTTRVPEDAAIRRGGSQIWPPISSPYGAKGTAFRRIASASSSPCANAWQPPDRLCRSLRASRHRHPSIK